MDERLAAFRTNGSRSALITDFDGTLAPIRDDPAAVAAEPGAVAALNAWAAAGVAVAIVSGRPVSALQTMLPGIDGVDLYGVYGMERSVGGVYGLDPRVEAAPRLTEAEAELRRTFPALRIENKLDRVIAVHWRESPDAEPAVRVAVAALAEQTGASVHEGRMVVELRTVPDVTKASTVAEVIGDRRHIVMAGDDVADVEAFAYLRGLEAAGGIETLCTIAVASDESPAGLLTHASLVLASPAALIAALL